MKKILLGFLFVSAAFAANAQKPLDPSVRGVMGGSQPLNTQDYKSVIHTNAKYKATAHSNWYSYYAVTQNSLDYKNYYNFLYPDSTAKGAYVDQTSGTNKSYYVGAHSVGQVLDPKSEYFDTMKYSNYTSYHWDSLAIFYQYRKYQPGINDTLIVQFYVNDKSHNSALGNTGLVLQNLQWTDPGTGKTVADPSARVQADKIRSRGMKPIKELTYILEDKDTQSTNVGAIVLPADIDVQPGGIVGFTMTYKPGYNNAMGDTIGDWRSAAPFPKNPLNIFKFFEGQEQNGSGNQKSVNDKSINSEELLIKAVKYSLPSANGWTTYIPGDAWLGYNSQLDAAFLLSSFNVGVNTSQNPDASVAVYPNPVSDIATANINLVKSGNVTVTVKNLLGQDIHTISNGTMNSGKNTVRFSTSDLNPGVYFLSINAGGSVATQKFVVSR